MGYIAYKFANKFLAVIACISIVAVASGTNPLTTYPATACLDEITTNYEIIRPDLDAKQENYKDFVDCCWIINLGKGRHVSLKFLTLFDVEFHKDCNYDYVQLKTANGKSLTDKICNKAYKVSGLPANIVVSDPAKTQNMRLCFHSDKSTVRKGFAVQVSSNTPLDETYPETPCESQIVGDATIRPPLTNGVYENNVDCCWSITSGSDWTRANFKFLTAFNIEAHDHCKFDYLQLKSPDGTSKAKLCGMLGTDLPPAIAVPNVTSLSLCFHTDHNTVAGGFAVKVSFSYKATMPPLVELGTRGPLDSYTPTQCNTHISNPSMIRLPVDITNDKYENNMDCCWNIIAPSNSKSINFQFNGVFDIEDHTDCEYDYLELKADGESKAKVCGVRGTNLPPDIVLSDITNANLCFHSDHSTVARGFAVLVYFQ